MRLVSNDVPVNSKRKVDPYRKRLCMKLIDGENLKTFMGFSRSMLISVCHWVALCKTSRNQVGLLRLQNASDYYGPDMVSTFFSL